MSTVAPSTETHGESHTTSRGLGWYGMVFFLGSEAVFFANLIASYLYLRVRAGSGWPHVDVDQKLAIANTIILVASSFVLDYATRALKKDNKRAFSTALLITVIMGAVFISIQLY